MPCAIGFTQHVVARPGNHRDVRLCCLVNPDGRLVASHVSMAILDARSAEMAARKQFVDAGHQASGLGLSVGRRSIAGTPGAPLGAACASRQRPPNRSMDRRCRVGGYGRTHTRRMCSLRAQRKDVEAIEPLSPGHLKV